MNVRFCKKNIQKKIQIHATQDEEDNENSDSKRWPCRWPAKFHIQELYGYGIP